MNSYRRAGVVSSILAWLSFASACSAGSPPTTNPQAMRELVLASRQGTLSGIEVTFQRTDSELGEAGAVQTLAANGHGVRYAIGETTFQYDNATKVFSRQDDGGVSQSSTPEQIQFGELVPEFEIMMGAFPTRAATGKPTFGNDLTKILQSPSVHIRNETEALEGIDCVVVEDVTPTGAGVRGYYAPGLGFAQVRFEFLGKEGRLISRWDCSGFVDVPGSTAVPTVGVFSRFDGTDMAQEWHKVEVTKDASGNPNLRLGSQANTSLVLPAGSWVESVEDGRKWQVAGDWMPAVEGVMNTHEVSPSRNSRDWLWYLLLVPVCGAAWLLGRLAIHRSKGRRESQRALASSH